MISLTSYIQSLSLPGISSHINQSLSSLSYRLNQAFSSLPHINSRLTGISWLPDSGPDIVNHVNLRNIPLRNTRSCLDFSKNPVNPSIETRIHFDHNLPGLIGQVGENRVFFLLDSGCFHNIIQASLIKEFECNFFSLDTFEHSVELATHTNGSIDLEPLGYLVPVLISDLSNKTFAIKIPFLVEKNSNTNIIGFRSIIDRNINISGKVTNIRINTNYENINYKERVCNISDLNNLSDGLAFIEKSASCLDCHTPHPAFISCPASSSTLSSIKSKDLINQILEYNPFSLIYNQSLPFEERLIEIKNGNIYDGNSKIEPEDLPPLVKLTYFQEKVNEVLTINELDEKDTLFIYLINELGECLVCSGNCMCINIGNPDPKVPLIDKNRITIKLRTNKEASDFSSCFKVIGPILQKANPRHIFIGHQNCVMRNSFGKKLPYLMELLFSLYPAPNKNNKCNNVNSKILVAGKVFSKYDDIFSDNPETVNAISQKDFVNTKIGIPDEVSAPQIIKTVLEEDEFSPELKSAINHSSPLLKEFLTVVFSNFDKCYAKHSTDLGELINPNYLLEVSLIDKNTRLPRHQPFECSLFSKKATDRILGEWEKSGIIEQSNIMSHAMRLLVVKKHLKEVDFISTKEMLMKKHNINIISQNDIFNIDPDYLPTDIILKSYCVVVDSRALNNLTCADSPLQQNPQNTLFQLILSLSKKRGG